jgi:microtubule-associated protein 1
MSLTMMQKKKHLLLLNRLMRTELKKDIIPVPSKLSEEEVNKFFERLFVKKTDGEDEYYVPIKSKVELKIDEELFKGLIKKPKVIKTKEDKTKMKEEEKMKKEEIQKSVSISVYNKFIKDFIKPMQDKRKAGEDVKKDEMEVVKKYIKLSQEIKNMIKKNLPNLFEKLLNPADKEREMRKEKLTEENKQLMKDIKTQAKEEKRMMKTMTE